MFVCRKNLDLIVRFKFINRLGLIKNVSTRQKVLSERWGNSHYTEINFNNAILTIDFNLSTLLEPDLPLVENFVAISGGVGNFAKNAKECMGVRQYETIR